MSEPNSAHRPIVLVILSVLVAACAPAPQTSQPPGVTGRVLSSPAHVSLAEAIRTGHDVGPVSPGTPIHLSLSLQVRNRTQFDADLAAGIRVTTAQYAAQFAPRTSTAGGILATLHSDGISGQWTAGDTTVAADTDAATAGRVFATQIDNFIGSDGTRFYAPQRTPAIPNSLSATVLAVSGLDNYPDAHMAAIRGKDGLTPADALDFYDINPLRQAGLDGSGQTIVFIEGDKFSQTMLDDFTTKFTLPAIHPEVHTNPAWGNPSDEQGEADLDLQVAHEIAPAAALVVYYASPRGNALHVAEQAIYHDFPGKIVSSSWGKCELSTDHNGATAFNDFTEAAAVQGTSIFVASGDRGAYDCVPSGDNTDLVADLDGGLPSVTSVGGTLVQLSKTGGYYKEAAWGEPAEQWGGSGGISRYWPRPAWQQGPGVDDAQYPNQMRESPDVSANADSVSGWDVFSLGLEAPVGGTSASTPFWAAVTALIDQDLAQKGLPSVGFANPALYLFGQHPAGLPAPAFHDVTVGTNLYYIATPGFDMATGLGTPDVAALADDFEWYGRNHPGGGKP